MRYDGSNSIVKRNILIGGTGVVGNLKVGDGPEVIGLRADMDALNLTETGTVWPGDCLDCELINS